MFGQPAAGVSPFGTQATSTPFGGAAAPTNAFGSPAPAAQQTSAFGASTSTFGAPAAAPAFGAAAPAPAFGAAPAATTGFGSVGAFGSPAPTPAPAFGAPATPFGGPAAAPATGGLFGAAPAAAPTGGLFGAPAPAAAPFGAPVSAAGGLFGAAPTPAPSAGFGFGAPAPAPSAFGAPAPAPSGGLFGSATPAPATGGIFGAAPVAAVPTTGLFGAPAPAPAAGGLFGSPAQAMGVAAGVGSLATPYQATRKVDGTSSITFQSITAMPQYEAKSFEELRLEDYMGGNKGSQGQAPPAAPAFGAPAPGAGVFGAPAPAAPSTGFGFGSTPAAAPATGLFGASTPAFGAAAPATGGLFGATPAAAPATGGLFGATPAAAPAGGLFGATPAAAPAGGLFGAAPAAPLGGSLFGATPAPAAGGLFGATPVAAPAAGGLFGAAPAATAAPVAGGFSFGAPTPAPVAGGLFGSPSPAPAAGGLFGAAPATTASPGTGGLFGATPAPATGGLFGAAPAITAAPATGGLFGATPAPATGGLFGAPPSAAPATGGFFGSTPLAAPAAGGLFGAPLAPAAPAAAPGATTILVPPSSETLLAQQMAAIQNQNKELAVLEAWRGGNGSASKKSGNGSKSGSVIPSSVFQRDAQAVRYKGLAGSARPSAEIYGNGNATSLLDAYKSAPRSAAKIRPRGFGPTISKTTVGQRSTTGMLSPTSFLGSATKQLVIKPGALTPKPKTRLLLSDDAVSEKRNHRDSESTSAPSPLIKGRILDNVTANGDTPSSRSSGRDRGLIFENTRIAAEKPAFASPDASAQAQERTTPAAASTSSTKMNGIANAKSPVDESYDFYKSVIGSPTGTIGGIDNGVSTPGTTDEVTNSLIPKLTKEGYDMTPSLEAMSQMSEADLAAVPNFVVERVGYGSVAWDGAVDVRGIDLDSVVCIEAKAVEVYHKEEEMDYKPVVGTKLNRPAILTLHNVYPKKGAGATIAEKEKFERKIAKQTKGMNASLVLYDSDIGVWKLRVEHFSRYALDDDSDDDENEVEMSGVEEKHENKTDFESGARGGRVLRNTNQVSWAIVEAGHTRFNVPDNEDEEFEENHNTLVVNDPEGQKIQAAKTAYNKISLMENESFQMEIDDAEEEEAKSCYVDEGIRSIEYIDSDIFASDAIPSSKISICAQLAGKCGVKRATSSATDYGMRMGRSFNVCWRPDGSFLHPGLTHTSKATAQRLVQSRPILDNGLRGEDSLLSVHLKNSVNTNESSEIPIFTLTDDNDAFLEQYDQTAKLITKEKDIVSQTFSLISLLFDKVPGKRGVNQKQEAFTIWLRSACAQEVEEEILEESNKENYYAAIFAALSGDNVPKAASLARAHGYNMLALMISNMTPSAAFALSNQMSMWQASGAIDHFPPELMRIYSILTKDLDIERNLFQNAVAVQGQTLDWKRRMLMLWKTMGCNGLPISALMNAYEIEVANGTAPFAWFAESASGDEDRNCTTFRLLKLYSFVENDGGKIPLSRIICPSGHNSNILDGSKSFHFAAIISALETYGNLSDAQEFSLLESYSSQLEHSGHWEWAVYVSLCRLSTKPLSNNIHRKKRMAMDIICRNYTVENDNVAMQKRLFLKNEVRIPDDWFDKALSMSALQKFDIDKFIQHTSITSTNQAMKVYEDAILPDVLFNRGTSSYQDILNFLDALGNGVSNELSLRGLVYHYLTLLIDVSKALNERNDNVESSYTYQDLLERAQSLRRYLQNLEKLPSMSWELFNGQSLVSKSVTLTELGISLESLTTRLNNNMAGKIESMSSSSSLALKNQAHLAFSSSNDDFVFKEFDSKAALRGKYKMLDHNLSLNNGLVYRPQRL